MLARLCLAHMDWHSTMVSISCRQSLRRVRSQAEPEERDLELPAA